MRESRTTRRRFMQTAGQFLALSSGLGAHNAFSQTKPSAAGPLQKASVRLEWLVYGAHAPWFVGLEHGTFAKHGLDLTVTPGRGSVVTAEVQVWVPLVATPWGEVGGLWVGASHSEPVDLYRSLP